MVFPRVSVVSVVVAFAILSGAPQVMAATSTGPTDAEAEAAYRKLMLSQQLYIAEVMRHSNVAFGVAPPPETPEEKADDERITENVKAAKIFISDKTKSSDGSWAVVVAVDDETPTTVSMLRGAHGWVIKCYEAQDGSRKCF